jgi:hypothetical protein
MKKTTSVVIFVLISIHCFAQLPNWIWAKSGLGTNYDGGNSIAVDLNGNIFVGGNFDSPSINFGAFTLTNSGNGTSDIFIVKYSNSGNVLWAKAFGGNNDDHLSKISTDSLGNVIFVGSFSSTTITFNTTTLINNGANSIFDMYFVKYNANGTNLIWAKSAGGEGYDKANDLVIDAFGNIIITGYFKSQTITFDAISLNRIGYDENIYVVKYNAIGNVIWAQSAGGNLMDVPYKIAADSDGNIIITAVLTSFVVYFGTYQLSNPSINYHDNIFIIKYSATGNFLWVKKVENVHHSFGNCWITTDADNNIIVCGVFTDPTISFGNFTLSNAGLFSSSDIFIVKYDLNANVLWAKSAGGSNYEFVRSITVDDSGDLIISGQFKSQSIFSAPNILTNSYIGYYDIFIAKYSSSGNLIWTESIGSNNDDFSGCTSLDNIGNILITGSFRSQNILFGSDTLYNFGNDDMFIAKLSNSNVYTVNQIACGYFNSPSGNYTWTNSGSYLDTITNISGIDSIILVNLIINPINTSISTVSACNSFYWINGQTYTTSNNSATFTYSLISGCDSIVTLNLTINNSSYTTDDIVACNSYTWIDGHTYTTSNNSVTYTLSNISGCDSVIALNLTINNLDTSITQNGTELTAIDINANYQWLDCNNGYTLLINDTNQSFTPLISGSYAVSLTSNGCVDTSGCFNLIVVGNDHLSSEKGYLKIFPNPNNGKFYINFTEQKIKGTVKVYDLNGQLLHNEYLAPWSNSKQLNLQSKLSGGIYALHLSFGEQTSVLKFVVVE